MDIMFRDLPTLCVEITDFARALFTSALVNPNFSICACAAAIGPCHRVRDSPDADTAAFKLACESSSWFPSLMASPPNVTSPMAPAPRATLPTSLTVPRNFSPFVLVSVNLSPILLSEFENGMPKFAPRTPSLDIALPALEVPLSIVSPILVPVASAAEAVSFMARTDPEESPVRMKRTVLSANEISSQT